MRDPHRRARGRRALAAVTLAVSVTVLTAAAGCRGGGPTTGRIRNVSLGPDPVMLAADLPKVFYAHAAGGDTSFFLTDVPASKLLDGEVPDGQVVHVELLWTPRAGATPMDSSATNASIRHIVMIDGELGVYGGAGFALPAGAPGARRLRVSVRDTNLRLLEATDGFEDPLTPSRIVGSFTAELDPQETLRFRRLLSQVVTNALGRTTFVRSGGGRAGEGRAGDGRSGDGRAGDGRAGDGRAGDGARPVPAS